MSTYLYASYLSVASPSPQYCRIRHDEVEDVREARNARVEKGPRVEYIVNASVGISTESYSLPLRYTNPCLRSALHQR